ncbi:hypothetical protein ABH15_11210 [Methanoculleus taiwanensis]|uniref:Uncharacterized protein n=1 Tax=Methanoculleus taiwanensis TaxID=1550565 RepID=A0A498GYZ8_9EURY|nr:hypothetical protein [Methanoculleus taiwanensis]RXE55325.1 hypothetical protein ABH15_11210 [Methanoculleus taiwanensis]
MIQKQRSLSIAAFSGIVCLAAAIAAAAGLLDLWVAELLLVFAFPPFIIFLALWWSASDGVADIPFIGY